MRACDSQPFVKNTPAGNILSAPILFGGGLPSQIMFVTYLHVHARCMRGHTHTHHEHHIIYVYHIYTQIHTQYTRTPTDVTHSGSFRVCINLFAYLLQPSAFLFTAHCVFCLESPPVLSADSTEECSKKANFRWGWEGWQSRTQRQVWVLYSYGFGRACDSGYAAATGAYTIVIVVHIHTI